jgi:hypothetical protein
MFANLATYCFVYAGMGLFLKFGDNFYYYYHRRRCHDINHRTYNNFDSDFLLFLLAQQPQWATASSFTRFLDHRQRPTTVGRTPLDE